MLKLVWGNSQSSNDDQPSNQDDKYFISWHPYRNLFALVYQNHIHVFRTILYNQQL